MLPLFLNILINVYPFMSTQLHMAMDNSNFDTLFNIYFQIAATGITTPRVITC